MSDLILKILQLFDCKHKFEDVKPDGFQYCKNCGIANKPVIPKIECSCELIDVETFNITDKSLYHPNKQVITGKIFVQKCKKCGKIYQTKITG